MTYNVSSGTSENKPYYTISPIMHNGHLMSCICHLTPGQSDYEMGLFIKFIHCRVNEQSDHRFSVLQAHNVTGDI